MTQKICVDQDTIGRGEGSVVCEEEGGWLLGDFADDIITFLLRFLYECGFFLVLLEPSIALADDTFRLAEFAGLLCLAHCRTSENEDSNSTSQKFVGIFLDPEISHGCPGFRGGLARLLAC